MNDILEIKRHPVALPAAILEALKTARQTAPAFKTAVIVATTETGGTCAILSLTDLFCLIEQQARTMALPVGRYRRRVEMSEIDPDWGSTAPDREWMSVCQPDRLDV